MEDQDKKEDKKVTPRWSWNTKKVCQLMAIINIIDVPMAKYGETLNDIRSSSSSSDNNKK